MTMTDRRTFIKATGASAVMLPFISHLAEANGNPLSDSEPSYFVRDQRYQASVATAETTRPDTARILDVNEDVTTAYLQLAQLSKTAKISAIAGVTAHTAKDILSTLFLPPEYELTFEHAVEEPRQDGVVKLWAWRYERTASKAEA